MVKRKLNTWAEMMEVGADVFVVNGEDRAPLPVGEYPLEDGTILVVAEEGKIAEVKEMAEEEVTEELSDETPSQMADEFKQLMKSLTIKYAEETKQLVTELKASFDVKLSEQNAIIEELKKTPATTAIKKCANSIKRTTKNK